MTGSAMASGTARYGLLALLLASAGILAVLAAAMGGPGRLQVGDPAPDFTLRTFDGQSLSLRELAGQVVVLNFWASWCVECEDEAADLQAIADDYGNRGVVVIGIDYVDTEPEALAFLEKFGITYSNGPDAGGRTSRAYGLTGVPETVVIDQAGRLVGLPLRGVDLPAPKLVGPLVEGGTLGPSDLRRVLDVLVGPGG